MAVDYQLRFAKARERNRLVGRNTVMVWGLLVSVILVVTPGGLRQREIRSARNWRWVWGRSSPSLPPHLPLLAVALYYGCPACHPKLCKLKLPPRDLTIFYLMIAPLREAQHGIRLH